MGARILIIDDDRNLAEGLAYNLDRASYDAAVALDGPAGLLHMETEPPDLVLLDLMLPGPGGMEVLARMRQAGIECPVIILSAIEDETEKVRGFDLGAVDYVTKPFGLAELLARIRVRLGSASPGAESDTLALASGTARLDRFVFDTGETDGRPREGIEPELKSSRNRLSFLVEKTAAPGFAGKLAAVSNAPWHRVTTDRGRTAWVQVLRPGDPGMLSVVRFVTRIDGEGDPGPAVANLFAVGSGESITIRFDVNAAYREYRVERRDGLTGEFRTLGITERASFTDRRARKDDRYAYRVTGIGEDGEEGIPAVTVGTTETRGIASGRIVVEAGGRHEIDLVRGRIVAKHGDLILHLLAESNPVLWLIPGKMMGRRSLGALVEPSDPKAAREVLPWDPDPRGNSAAEDENRWYRIPLREGGTARFRYRSRPGKRIEIDYAVNPDGPRFDLVPEIAAKRTDTGVDIRVEAPAAYTVRGVTVADFQTGRTLARIPVEKGQATDVADRTGRVVAYRVTGEDRYGRKTLAGEAILNFLPPGLTRGRFRFHYEDAWSFTRLSVVGPEDADLVFESCAGGLSGITLRAPGGITNLSRLRIERERIPSVSALSRALVGAVPAEIQLSEKASGDSRDARSDVFVMRTRDGRWVKLALVFREREGDWTKRRVSVEYVINPGAPVFETVETFDEVLDELADTTGLILDMRANGGGDELAAVDIAGRFVPEERIYSKHQRRSGPGRSALGDPVERRCAPRGPWRYRRPVMLLQGMKTFGTAESFVLMLRGGPQVTTIGDRTAGSSGCAVRHDVGAGIEIYVPGRLDMDPEGRPIDRTGVAPDVPVTVPSIRDRPDDPIMLEALRRLRSR